MEVCLGGSSQAALKANTTLLLLVHFFTIACIPILFSFHSSVFFILCLLISIILYVNFHSFYLLLLFFVSYHLSLSLPVIMEWASSKRARQDLTCKVYTKISHHFSSPNQMQLFYIIQGHSIFVIVCMVHVYSVCTTSDCYVFKFCKKSTTLGVRLFIWKLLACYM